MSVTVYDNYAKIRDKNHMSDYYVGKKTNFNRSIFYFWKKGVQKPTRESVERLAAFFKVPVEYFYEGVDDEKTKDSSCAS